MLVSYKLLEIREMMERTGNFSFRGRNGIFPAELVPLFANSPRLFPKDSVDAGMDARAQAVETTMRRDKPG